MADNTPRLNLDRYDAGDQNWDHTDLVNLVDEYAIDRAPLADRPTSGEYDDVLYYATDEGVLYRWDKATTSWVSEIGGSGEGYSTIAPIASELETGYAIEQGVPVKDGQTLTIISWGVRTDAGTTPTGLKAQLTQIDGTVINEESTAYSEPSASVTNSSGGTKWYNFRIKNETGTTYDENSTPSRVLGNFVYDLS